MIRKIEYLRNLSNLHLVVLSACETGLGETNPDGKEIQGISAYFTGGESKAKAVLSSLECQRRQYQ
jgi:CHAT domain-containing protein